MNCHIDLREGDQTYILEAQVSLFYNHNPTLYAGYYVSDNKCDLLIWKPKMLTKNFSVFYKHKCSVWCIIDLTPLHLNKSKQRRPDHYVLCSVASSAPPLKIRQCLVHTRSHINQTSEHYNFLHIFRSTLQDSCFIYQQISEQHNLFSIGMVNVNVGRIAQST